MISGAIRQYDKGTTFESIVKEYQPKYNYSIALVYFNGKMRELNKRLERDGALSFITTADSAGHNAYVRTAQMMLVKAASEILGETDKTPMSRSSFPLEMPASAVFWAGSVPRPSWLQGSKSACVPMWIGISPSSKRPIPSTTPLNFSNTRG